MLGLRVLEVTVGPRLVRPVLDEEASFTNPNKPRAWSCDLAPKPEILDISKELVVPRPPALDSPTSESERLARPLAGGGAASSAQPALGACQ